MSSTLVVLIGMPKVSEVCSEVELWCGGRDVVVGRS